MEGGGKRERERAGSDKLRTTPQRAKSGENYYKTRDIPNCQTPKTPSHLTHIDLIRDDLLQPSIDPRLQHSRDENAGDEDDDA